MDDIRDRIKAKHARAVLLVSSTHKVEDYPEVTAFEMVLVGAIASGTEDDRYKLYKVYPEYVAAFAISREPQGLRTLEQIVAKEEK